MCSASRLGLLEMCRLLLQNGADVNAGNPLSHSVQSGDLEVCRLLLQNGANVSAEGYTEGCTGLNPLQNAAFHGHLEICRLLLQNGAEVNQRSRMSR